MLALAASFLNAGTACHLERLICIVGTDPGLCSPEGTHRDLDQCLCQQCRLWRHSFLMALHDKPDSLCSAGAAVSIATSSRQSLGRWGFQTFTTCISLNSISNAEPHRIAHDACCLWLLIDCNFPFAIVGRRESLTPRLAQVLVSSSELSELLQLSPCLGRNDSSLSVEGTLRYGNMLMSMNISAEQAFISGVSHFNGHFMTLDLAV